MLNKKRRSFSIQDTERLVDVQVINQVNGQMMIVIHELPRQMIQFIEKKNKFINIMQEMKPTQGTSSFFNDMHIGSMTRMTSQQR
jgi:hypothetical protein